MLVWEYAWWRWPNVWLVIVAYTAGFYLTTVFYDLRSRRTKVAIVCGIYAVDVLLFAVFANVLGWI